MKTWNLLYLSMSSPATEFRTASALFFSSPRAYCTNLPFRFGQKRQPHFQPLRPLSLMALSAPLYFVTTTAFKMKPIIDTDPGDDDIIAILLALSRPDTEVIAYIASFGNVDVEHTYNNLLKLYGVLDKHVKAHPEAMDRYQSLKHVSTLIKGACGPIEGPSPGDGAFFHGSDGKSYF